MKSEIQKFKEHIIDNNLISYNDSILVGFSGGADSTFMLELLCSIKDEFNLSIHPIYINHLYRENSHNDEVINKKFCNSKNLELHIHKESMQEYAKKNKTSLEEAGRLIRYNAFKKYKEMLCCNKIATAHNKNDVIETFFINLFRGSGINGLSSIPQKYNNIIRPILIYDREEIECYLKKKNIDYVIDETNLENIFTRNKIRNSLLPYIKKEFNPQIISTIYNTTRVIESNKEYINGTLQSLNSLIYKHNNKCMINIDEYNALHIIQKNYITREAIKYIKGNVKDISYKNITDMINLCETKKTGKKIYYNDFLIEIEYDNIVFKKHTKKEKKKSILKVDISDKVNINYGKYNIIMSLTTVDEYKNNEEKNIRFINADKIDNHIIIRNRKDGDKFKPYGMNKSKKIKDFFIDNKVPKNIRDELIVLESDSNIISVHDMRINEDYKVTNKTKKVLKFIISSVEN